MHWVLTSNRQCSLRGPTACYALLWFTCQYSQNHTLIIYHMHIQIIHRMTTSTVYTMVSLCQTKHMLSIVIFQVVELINFNFAFYECYLLFDRPLITFLLLFRCILHWRQAKPCATETSSDTVIVSCTYIHFRYIRWMYQETSSNYTSYLEEETFQEYLSVSQSYCISPEICITTPVIGWQLL